MKLLVLAALSVLMAALWVAPAQAQSVTYRPNFYASDLSGFGPNGGTINLVYERVGNAANSPFGASFTVALTFTDFTSPFGSQPSLKLGAVEYGNGRGLLWGYDINDLVASDLPHYTNAEGETLMDTDPLGNWENLLAANPYSFSVSLGNLPNSPGWSVAQDEDNGIGGAQGSGGYEAGPNGGSLNYRHDIGSDHHSGGGVLDFGSSIDLGVRLYVTGSTGPASEANLTDYMQNQFTPSPYTYGLGIGFSDLIFTPVPEPSGALLVMAGGLVLLIRRRSRRG